MENQIAQSIPATASVDPLQVPCPRCQQPIPIPDPTGSMLETQLQCPSCQKTFHFYGFPALKRRLHSGDRPARIEDDQEASCFFHPDKRATAICAECGRFICDLCKVEEQGQILCPTCLDRHLTEAKAAQWTTSAPRYDNLALTAAVVPFVIGFFPAVIGIPLTFYYIYRGIRAPTPLTGKRPLRFVIAFLLAVIEGVILYLVLSSILHAPLPKY